jgi:hypothetical protein
MSAKLLGIMSHSLSDLERIITLPERIQHLGELAAEVSRQYWEKPSIQPEHPNAFRLRRHPKYASAADEWAHLGGLFFQGEGAWIGVGPRTLFADTIAKWSVAVRREPLLNSADTFFSSLARSVASPSYLICSDHASRTWDWVFSGRTIEEIEKTLDGDRARRVPELHNLLIRDEDRTPNAYFVGYVA